MDESGEGTIEAKKLALICRELALDKKAENPLVLDMRAISTITDFFVICTGTSSRHTRTIAENITKSLKSDHKILMHHSDGATEGRWVVLDYIDVIVHIFDEETREIYSLETLWGDAEKVE
jgi:ribosome-associated protein